MDWQTLRQDKGQSVHEYTQDFRKRALILGIPLYTQETLLKYIGVLHDYSKHTIIMFNPTIGGLHVYLKKCFLLLVYIYIYIYIYILLCYFHSWTLIDY
jgi:hypothetical protein